MKERTLLIIARTLFATNILLCFVMAGYSIFGALGIIALFFSWKIEQRIGVIEEENFKEEIKRRLIK